MTYPERLRQKAPPKDLAVPIEAFDYVVKEEDLPCRLDSFVKKRLPWRSRNFFQTLIDRGLITINGRAAKAGRYLLENEKVHVDIKEFQQEHTKADIPLDIIYEDEALLVLNKAPGVIVHPTGVHLYDTLLNAVHARYKDEIYRPTIVHRLDKDTSGVLVLVKSEKFRTHLAQQIEKREVRKSYRALAHGVFSQRQGEITFPIAENKYSHIRLKQMICADGLPSLSLYDVRASAPVVKNFQDGLSLVDVHIKTGRTHQIRVHLAALGHPIVADTLYGREDEALIVDVKISTQLLHARSFICRHPLTEKEIEFIAPLPKPFQAAVQSLFPSLPLD